VHRVDVLVLRRDQVAHVAPGRRRADAARERGGDALRPLSPARFVGLAVGGVRLLLLMLMLVLLLVVVVLLLVLRVLCGGCLVGGRRCCRRSCGRGVGDGLRGDGGRRGLLAGGERRRGPRCCCACCCCRSYCC